MAPNIPEIWNPRSRRMVDGSSRGSLPRFSQAFSYRLQEDETMLKRILATTAVLACCALPLAAQAHEKMAGDEMTRSEEHTSELQSRLHLVCRLLLEKKKRWTWRKERCTAALS